jgi:hypothetical protein
MDLTRLVGKSVYMTGVGYAANNNHQSAIMATFNPKRITKSINLSSSTIGNELN